MQHSFQPYENDILTMNPFKINEEPALLTCGTEGHVNTMTISWGGLGVIWNKDREFDNLIRYEVHQSQIWLIFFVKS